MSTKTDLEVIAKRLRMLADLTEANVLEPAQVEFLKDSLLPALGFLLQKDLDFLAVIAYGEQGIIQDWLNNKDAPFFEIAGRLHNLATTFGQIAIKEDLQKSEECQGSDGSRKLPADPSTIILSFAD